MEQEREDILKSAVIVCFSPTGGCRKLAEYLSSNHTGLSMEILDITRPGDRARLLPMTEYLIVVTPVYAQDLPEPVSDYLRRLTGGGNTPATVITMYGGIHRGRALFHAADILRRRGYFLASAAEIIGPHSYGTPSLSFGKADLDKESLILVKNLVQKTMAKLEEPGAGKRSVSYKRGRKHFLACLPQRWLACWSAAAPSTSHKQCVRCNRCKLHCPVSAIGSGLTVNAKRCIRCFGCVHICPKGLRRADVFPLCKWYLRRFYRERAPAVYL